MPYLFFLGNHPLLAASEAVAVLTEYGLSPTVELFHDQLLQVRINAAIPLEIMHRLGGTDRIASLSAEFPQEPGADEILDALSPPLPSDMKAVIGVSTIGLPARSSHTLGTSIKKAARARGSKVAFITPKKGNRLNAAQIIFNQLTERPHREITLIKHEQRWLLTETLAVQDIAAYERRDTARPARDAAVGLLPPKLAQIMLNLSRPHWPSTTGVIWDPFCGMGTLLQEGWLMSERMLGSDLSERMVAMSQQNLSWLAEHFSVSIDVRPVIFDHDATASAPELYRGAIRAIVTEPFLGDPVSRPLPAPEVPRRLTRLAALYKDFLAAVSPTLVPGATILMALPRLTPRAIKGGKNSGASLAQTGLLDEAAKLGYRRVDLIPEALQAQLGNQNQDLIYGRPDAFVARELVLWKKE